MSFVVRGQRDIVETDGFAARSAGELRPHSVPAGSVGEAWI
jgi:hypothetical protein